MLHSLYLVASALSESEFSQIMLQKGGLAAAIVLMLLCIRAASLQITKRTD